MVKRTWPPWRSPWHHFDVSLISTDWTNQIFCVSLMVGSHTILSWGNFRGHHIDVKLKHSKSKTQSLFKCFIRFLSFQMRFDLIWVKYLSHWMTTYLGNQYLGLDVEFGVELPFSRGTQERMFLLIQWKQSVTKIPTFFKISCFVFCWWKSYRFGITWEQVRVRIFNIENSGWTVPLL